MIVDTLDHAENYKLGPRFEKAFAFLKDPQSATLAPGHYVIEKDAAGKEVVYANVQAYATRPADKCALEYHRDYADVQFLFEGDESIGYRALTPALAETKAYDPAGDIGFVAGEGTWVPFEKNTFFVLFPQDAHAPGHTLTSASVKKVVVKVLL